MNGFVKDILNEVSYYYTTGMLNEGMAVPKLFKTFKIQNDKEKQEDLERVLMADPGYQQGREIQKPDGTVFQAPGNTGDYGLFLANLWKNGQLSGNNQEELDKVHEYLVKYSENKERVVNNQDGENRIDNNSTLEDLYNIVDNVINGLAPEENVDEVDPFDAWLNEPEEGTDGIKPEESLEQKIDRLEAENIEPKTNNNGEKYINWDLLYAIGRGPEYNSIHKRPDGTVPQRQVGQTIDGEKLIYADNDWIAIAEESFEAGKNLAYGNNTFKVADPNNGKVKSARPDPGWCVDASDHSWNEYANQTQVNGKLIHIFSLHPQNGSRGHYLLSRYFYNAGKGGKHQRLQIGPSVGYTNPDRASNPISMLRECGGGNVLGVLQACLDEWKLPFGKCKGDDYSFEEMIEDNPQWGCTLDDIRDAESNSDKPKLTFRQTIKLLADDTVNLTQLFKQVIPIRETGDYIVSLDNAYNIVTKDRQLVFRVEPKDWFNGIRRYGYKSYYQVSREFNGQVKFNLLNAVDYSLIVGNFNDLGNWFQSISKPTQDGLVVVRTEVLVMGDDAGEDGRRHAMRDEQGNNIVASRKNILNLETKKLLIDGNRYGWFNVIGNMVNGFSVVGKTENQKQDEGFTKRFNFVNPNGEMLFNNPDQNTWPDNVSNFSRQGFALVGRNGGYQLVNKERKLIPSIPMYSIGNQPEDGQINSVPMFDKGFINVCYNHNGFAKYNVMTNYGDMLIPMDNIDAWSDEEVQLFTNCFVISIYDNQDQIRQNAYTYYKRHSLFGNDYNKWPSYIRPLDAETMIAEYPDGREEEVPISFDNPNIANESVHKKLDNIISEVIKRMLLN